MQVESFKVFRDLVESQSFSKAAALNFITQSAVSQQIRALEERFQATLLERRTKKLGLTREGKLFYEAAKTIVQHYDTLVHQLEEMREVVAGAIRVATVYSIGLHELPPYLKEFLRSYPQVNVHVEYRRANQVYDDVLEGAADLGLVAFPTPRKNIKIIPFRQDRLVVICNPEHPLAKRGSDKVPLEELSGQKLVGFEPDIPTRKAIDRILRGAKIDLKPIMEFDNVETVKRAVEIDAGISIVPRATVAQEVSNGTLKAFDLEGGSFSRPLAILHRAGRVLSPAIQRFLAVLQEGVVAQAGSEPAREIASQEEPLATLKSSSRSEKKGRLQKR